MKKVVLAAILVAFGCSSEPRDGPAGAIRAQFPGYVISIPKGGACKPVRVEPRSLRFVIRPPNTAFLARRIRPLIPDVSGMGCPKASEGLEVGVHRLSGKITAVGRGNMIDDRVRGPPTALAYQALNAGEAYVLRSFFGRSALNQIGNGEDEAPVRYVCDGDRCRAAFRYGENLVTLLWSPRAVHVPAHQIVNHAASHLEAWSEYQPSPPSISRVALRRARADAREALRIDDLRPVAYLGIGPGQLAWVVDGFGGESGHKNFRGLDERTQVSLGNDLAGYVLEYNRVITRHLRCPASKVGAPGMVFAEPYVPD